MNRFSQWMDSLFRRLGWQVIFPTGQMAPDNKERFDPNRLPEQYEEFHDLRRPNKDS